MRLGLQNASSLFPQHDKLDDVSLTSNENILTPPLGLFLEGPRHAWRKETGYGLAHLPAKKILMISAKVPLPAPSGAFVPNFFIHCTVLTQPYLLRNPSPTIPEAPPSVSLLVIRTRCVSLLQSRIRPHLFRTNFYCQHSISWIAIRTLTIRVSIGDQYMPPLPDCIHLIHAGYLFVV